MLLPLPACPTGSTAWVLSKWWCVTASAATKRAGWQLADNGPRPAVRAAPWPASGPGPRHGHAQPGAAAGNQPAQRSAGTGSRCRRGFPRCRLERRRRHDLPHEPAGAVAAGARGCGMESEPVTETGAIQRVSAVFFYGFVLLLAWLVFLIFRPFLTPLTWAGILVILFQPLDRWLEERLGRTGAAAVSTLVATLVLLVPVSIVVVQFVRQALELMAGL